MYKRIVLAFDNTVEGRVALREGALLAKACGADVFLLSVISENSGVTFAEGFQPGVVQSHRVAYEAILQQGLAKLRELGFNPSGKLAWGEPTQQISDYVRQVGADLVVVGHRRQSFIERWWSGPSGLYIVDNVACSLLVARTVISDTAFEAAIRASDAGEDRKAAVSMEPGQ